MLPTGTGSLRGSRRGSGSGDAQPAPGSQAAAPLQPGGTPGGLPGPGGQPTLLPSGTGSMRGSRRGSESGQPVPAAQPTASGGLLTALTRPPPIARQSGAPGPPASESSAAGLQPVSQVQAVAGAPPQPGAQAVLPADLFGLAADLAGQGAPSASAVPGPLDGQSPARLGHTRVGQVLNAHAATRLPPPEQPPDQLGLAEYLRAQSQAPPPMGDGEPLYGLAVELLQGQQPFFGADNEAAEQRRAQRARMENNVARLGMPPAQSPGQYNGQRPDDDEEQPLDPFTIMEMAANQPDLPEPDYGIVAELRGRVPPDPFATDFGLVAEVARRRQRAASPLGRSGILPPLRARRRLDAVMGPDDLSLAEQIALRQRALDPFSRGGEDPFALADEQLKVPKELLKPYEGAMQELPDGEPIDDEQYGLASELGIDAETARKRREEQERRRKEGLDPFGMPTDDSQLPGQPEFVEPPGHRYVYDEDTGMLITTAGGQGDGARNPRQYIEDEATGHFYKLHSKRLKLFNLLRRKEPGIMEDEDEIKGFRGGLKKTLIVITSFFNILGMFAQGLVGGFALLNFFMTYFLYNGDDLTDFLQYYGWIAQICARIYYTLITFSVIAATARLARDKLRDFQPRYLWLQLVDYGQVLLYVAAYVCTVLATPLDDQLTYEYRRNPRFYQLTFSKGFKDQMALWNTLNIMRAIFVGIAWILACYQVSPYVFESTLRAEIRWKYGLTERQAAAVANAVALGMSGDAAAAALKAHLSATKNAKST